METDAQVRALTFTGDRCTGIEAVRDGRTHSARSRHDVIVSAGTIGSAQLLLLSGIGPADELRALGLPVRADLPGVGRNLHDHLLVPVVWESARPLAQPRANRLEVQFFAKSDPAMAVPDLQPLMASMPLPVPGYDVPAQAYGVLAGLIRPLSRGRLWLRSADPRQAPVLDPQIFAEPQDLTAMQASVEMCRDIGEGKALADWRVREVAPGPQVKTADRLRAYIRRTVISYHHRVGTCRMGVDSQAVVDPALRVHGLANLRIADASVMPSVPSGNTNAPTR